MNKVKAIIHIKKARLFVKQKRFVDANIELSFVEYEIELLEIKFMNYNKSNLMGGWIKDLSKAVVSSIVNSMDKTK